MSVDEQMLETIEHNGSVYRVRKAGSAFYVPNTCDIKVGDIFTYGGSRWEAQAVPVMPIGGPRKVYAEIDARWGR